MQMEGASCGAVVKGLGGSEENCLQWRNLHRRRGGKHTLELRYRSDTDCEAVLTVNGVSLTVIAPTDNTFTVAIIPYTHDNTNFGDIEIGTTVNIEFDILGKYIARLRHFEGE